MPRSAATFAEKSSSGAIGEPENMGEGRGALTHTHTLTHSHTHSLTHTLTHSLTHSWLQVVESQYLFSKGEQLEVCTRFYMTYAQVRFVTTAESSYQMLCLRKAIYIPFK